MEERQKVSIDDLVGAGVRGLFEDIDREYRAAVEAMARGDMEAWVKHAARGAELFEKAAWLNGWRD
jgi:hypothetical protein